VGTEETVPRPPTGRWPAFTVGSGSAVAVHPGSAVVIDPGSAVPGPPGSESLAAFVAASAGGRRTPRIDGTG